MSFGAPEWLWPAVGLGIAALVLVVRSYRRAGDNVRLRAAAGLKLLGFLLLLACLTEPRMHRVRARPGANQLLLLVDTSRSLSIHEQKSEAPRADAVRRLLAPGAPWLSRLGQDFDLRRFAFDASLRSFDLGDLGELSGPGEALEFDGRRSDLSGALTRLAARSVDRAVAGIVLVTDGIATDAFREDFDWDLLPPVHALVIGRKPERDLALGRLEVTQTSFEETPVVLAAEIHSVGCRGEKLRVRLFGPSDELLETQDLTARDEPQEVRFHTPPSASGVHFYRLHVDFAKEPSTRGAKAEATLANNTRWAVVDRGAGAHRLLYVSGRPNWEFKFLRRALQEDSELDLVGLIRIARRQPRFSFREGSDRRNQLWSGFDNRDAEVGEQLDEPVLLRLGTRNEKELRSGFPTTAEELFEYQGLVLDDVEAGFFTPDQQVLIEDFVARRGGGLLMLGGEQSYVKGGYRRTPLGDALPVYLDAQASDAPLSAAGYALELTREGWLEPWVRLRSTEELERGRLASMPAFRTLNQASDVKPGASVLLVARAAPAGSAGGQGATRPALVTQRFGRGRSAAMLIGDLWRWDLQRPEPKESDLGTTWRQTLRWLVADVPRRVQLDLVRGDERGEMHLDVGLRDAAYEAVHNATLSTSLEGPDGVRFPLDMRPSATEASTWSATFAPRVPGPFRVRVEAFDAAGALLGKDEAGWVSEPDAEEFRRLSPDTELLAAIAERSGGSLLRADQLDDFAANLAHAEVPITETEEDPIWHRWWILLSALACFCGEWGLRRIQGMP